MIATITELVFDVSKTSAKGNNYKVHEFSYQGPEFDGRQKPPTKRNVFTDSDVGKVLNEYKVGDSVELTFTKNGKFSDLVAIAPAGQSGTQGTSGASKPQPYSPPANEDRDMKISRAVALKAASEQLAGTFPKTAKNTSIVKDIVGLAEGFMPYLTLNDVDVTKAEDGLDDNLPD